MDLTEAPIGAKADTRLALMSAKRKELNFMVLKGFLFVAMS